ncbi:MAG: DUF305 domain-containing protein [Chloroflexota bacterium]|nr:DUF305 domain-containing protein [Chloroflexota bacterium]
MKKHPVAADPPPPPAPAAFEIAFMQAMIPHHQGAIAMAQLAPTRAAHADVKDLATRIITDQSREIAQMTGWLQSWYGTTPQAGTPAGMGGMGSGMGGMMGSMNGDTTALAALTGDAFDREFLIEMRTHHQMALMMTQAVPTRAVHPELQTLGRNILRNQAAEITQFESWLHTWYQVDAGQLPNGMMGSSVGGLTGPTVPEMPRTGDRAGLDSAWLQVGLLLVGAGALLLALRRRSTT